ncbi:hypothetical protein FKP32DRAFT_1601861 [Trametes sanguinea]|nr:hypothetical protein FKP32DRAFT_1601861 [Trametes sanguinea]
MGETFIFKDAVWLETHRTQGRAAYVAQFQCLFTFGLLEAVMETKVSEDTLLSTNDTGKTIMTASRLPRLLHEWRMRILAVSDEGSRASWADRSANELKRAHAFLQLELLHADLSRITGAPIPKNVLAAVVNAIACLAEAITSSWHVFRVRAPGPGVGVNWSIAYDITSETKASLIRSGWCPFLLRSVDGSCAVEYASTVPPPRGNVRLSHSGCKPSSCVVNNIDLSTYTTRHVSEDCSCPAVAPRLDDVHNGGRSTTLSGPTPCALVEQILPGGHIWMDSLCVPGVKRVRKLAIGLMAQTYQNAQTVVVLDSSIQACSPQATAQARLLHVVTSAWMHRLWTLQEAMLARQLVFEFAGRALVDVQDLLPGGEDLCNPLLVQLASELYRLRTFAQRRTDMSLFHVAQALQWRTTSRAEDETLAVSGLLDLEASALVGLHGDDRMRAFLLAVGKLSRTIIFLPGPRLQIPAFTWAPKTLMTNSGSTMSFPLDDSEGDVAHCTPNGLSAEYSVVYFKGVLIDPEVTPDWFVKEPDTPDADGLVFKLKALSSPEAASRGGPFFCSCPLFNKFPRLAAVDICIAAHVTITKRETGLDSGQIAGHDKDRFRCRYVRRLMAIRVPALEMEGSKEPVVAALGSGRMKVLMI